MVRRTIVPLLLLMMQVEGYISRYISSYNHIQRPTTFASKLSSSSVTDDEVERYRNRSVLLETTLRHKLEALKLSDQKLHVLQDAVKRIVRRNEQNVAHATDKAVAEKSQDLKELREQLSAHQLEILEWKGKYERTKTARMEAVNELGDLRRQWNEMNASASNGRNALVRDLEDLQKVYRRDQEAWKKNAQRYANLEQELASSQEAHNDAKRQIRKLEAAAAEAERELSDLGEEDRTSILELRQSLEKERQRRASLKTRFMSLADEKERLEAQCNELLEKQGESSESVQIAQAAVVAAERREKVLRQELKTMKEGLDGALQQNLALKVQLQHRPSKKSHEAPVKRHEITDELVDFLDEPSTAVSESKKHDGASVIHRRTWRSVASNLMPGRVSRVLREHILPRIALRRRGQHQ